MNAFLRTLFILLLTLHYSTQAQTVFAPPASEWYNDMDGYGVFHSYYAGDTTIEGISCRKVAQKALMTEHWQSLGFQVYDHLTEVVYNTADTVFVYNTLLHRFTPLYIFNVSAGDTVTLAITQLETAYYSTAVTGGDSTYSYIVDSVALVNYGGNMLKTVYTHPVTPAMSSDNYLLIHPGTTGVYAEQIGNLDGGLMPVCRFNCVATADDRVKEIGAVRCYTDPAISWHRQSVCDLSAVGVNSLAATTLQVFPDPASDVLHITGGTSLADAAVYLVDMRGVKYLVQKQLANNEIDINVSTFAEGVYLLHIVQGDEMVNRRVVVGR